MTTPGPGEEPTTLDPGRPEPGDSPTTLDRGPRPEDDATTLDGHGGGPPGGPGPPGEGPPGEPDYWGDSRLPPELAGRFSFERELPGHAVQAAVYQVSDKASGELAVVKLYRQNLRPDQQVWDWLGRLSRDARAGGGRAGGAAARHVVRVTDTGMASGRAYEVMEYLAGGDLYELPRRGPMEVDPDLLAEAAGQVAQALAAAHAAGIIHRDVKPGNILIRQAGAGTAGTSALDVALVDFGISTYVGPAGQRFNPTRSMSYRYAAPEWLQGRGFLSPAVDWWALGMTIAELAGGAHPFEEMEDYLISLHFSAGRAINLALVKDPRLALLCRGLLVRDPKDRWNHKQVAEWCRGESPEVRGGAGADAGQGADDEDDAREPFSYLDRTYWTPVELAVALARDWDVAIGYFFSDGRKPDKARPDKARPDKTHWRRLSEWLATLTDAEHDEASRKALIERVSKGREPADVKLLRLVRWLYRRLEPIYRTVVVTPAEVPGLALAAIGDPSSAGTGESTARTVIEDLWEHRLLAELAQAPGCADLTGIDQRWRTNQHAWDAFAASRGQRDPYLRQLLGEVPDDQIRYYLLWLASAESTARRHLREIATATQERLAVPLPWYSDLAGPQAGLLSLLCAALLAGVARAEARRTLEDRRAEQRRRHRMLTQRRLDDWRRRQNRPIALGWAASGVAIVAAFWIWLIGLSDVLPFASDQAVDIAWIGVVLSLMAFGAAEIWLATAIGGPYHPGGYSLINSGLSTAGRALRPLRRRGAVLLVIFAAGVLGLIAATSYIPLVLPLACTAGEFAWVRSRYRRWLADEEARAEELRLAAREFRADSSGLTRGNHN